MKDELGTRMKEQYELRSRYFLPRRTFTIIRLDGKAFHTYTRGLQKPFDDGLSDDMDNAIIAMLPQIQGAIFAYTQSDEISILLTDFEKPTTNAWFDGNIQKISSVSASIITAEFNRLQIKRYTTEDNGKTYLDLNDYGLCFNDWNSAYFDSRVFTIPDRTEVMNYFIWRNQDCARNSVSMVAQSLFSHKELQGKSTAEMQEMMFQQHNINWSTYDQAKKNGRLIVKESYRADNLCFEISLTTGAPAEPIMRSKWVSKPAWKFTEDMTKLKSMIPNYE